MHFKSNVAIFVDGSNLYHSLRKVLGTQPRLLDFDYRAFTDACVPRDYSIISRSYYIGVVRRPSNQITQSVSHAQSILFNWLRSSGQRFILREGDLRYRNGVFREKGVDVLLAIDLVIGALRDEFDSAVLISSDSDLIPAVEFVRSLGKQVFYVAFDGRRTIGLSKKASKTIIWTKASLIPFL